MPKERPLEPAMLQDMPFRIFKHGKTGLIYVVVNSKLYVKICEQIKDARIFTEKLAKYNCFM